MRAARPFQVVPRDHGFGRNGWWERRYLPLEEAPDRLTAGIQIGDEVTAAANQLLAGVPHRICQDTMVVIYGLVHHGAVHGVYLRQWVLIFEIGYGGRRQYPNRAAGLVANLEQVQLPLEIGRHR